LPRQLVLYMAKEDEDSFLQYLRSPGHVVILPSTSASSDFTPISVLPEPTEDEITRRFWLQNRTVSLPVVAEYAAEKNGYVIDGFQSPVVEYLRPWMVYGLSPSWRSKGSSISRAASSICPETMAVFDIFVACSAAANPARRPKTSRSEREFPPNRFAPWSPAAASPAANSPASEDFAVSASTRMPPIM